MNLEFDAVLFDLDGTVLDSHAYTFAAFRHAVSPWRVQPSDATIHAAFGPSERFILRRFVAPQQIDEAYARLQDWYRTQAHRAAPHPRIPAVLDRLALLGVSRGLFTGRGADSTQLLLRHHGLEQCFEAIVSGDSPCAPKPSGEGVRWLVERLRCAAHRVLVVGDSRLDVQAAVDAGVHAVGASWFTPAAVSGIDGVTLAHPDEILSVLGASDVE